MFRRYTCVKQSDRSDCGAACLATLAVHHKIAVSHEQLRELTSTDRSGTTIWGLHRAATSLGFSSAAVRGEYEDLQRVPLPAIAHVRSEDGLGHFLVVHRVRRSGVVVADPARGVCRLTREEYQSIWCGSLLLATCSAETKQGAKASGGGSWHRFLRLLLQQRSLLFEALCCAILMTLLGVGTSYFVQQLVDSVLVGHEVRLLNGLGCGMILVVLFRTLFGALRQYLLAMVARSIDLKLIGGYARHLVHLPLRFYEMRQVGEILSRVNDAAKVREAISGTALALIVDGVLVTSSTILLWYTDPPLALLATAYAPLFGVCGVIHHPFIRHRSRSAMEDAANLSAHLVEDISGAETIKAFGIENDRAKGAESWLVRLVQQMFQLEKIAMSMGGVSSFLAGIAGISVLWFGGHRVIDGALTIGQLLFFYTLLSYMLSPLERLAGVHLQLEDACVAMERMSQVLDAQPESDNSRKVSLPSVSDHIELDRVSFRYGCRGKVLREVTLRIPAGKTVAIVGESGSGKSTLLKLLFGFYAPDDGRLLVDGHDLRDLDLSSLRSRLGFVSQDPFIFNGTIRENIAIGQPHAKPQRIIEAARVAGLDEFVATLPERYESVIGERGANLSGGQRQRLAIARAIFKDPDVLVFDEATSHLDTTSERSVQQSLRRALGTKTVVLVAHRLSTVRQADLIYVMHAGRVVESGDHDQLINRAGRYADLWRAQSGTGPDTASRRCICPTVLGRPTVALSVRSH